MNSLALAQYKDLSILLNMDAVDDALHAQAKKHMDIKIGEHATNANEMVVRKDKIAAEKYAQIMKKQAHDAEMEARM